MIKLTQKAASLLLMVLVSTTVSAQSPWAAEEAAAESSSENIEPLPENDNGHYEDSRPVTIENQSDEIPPLPESSETPPQTEVVQQQGDVLSTPGATDDQPIAVKVLDFPRRGMSSDKVKNELGQPSEILPAVGEPPISRWVYDDRIVYFEYSTVLHVVAR